MFVVGHACVPHLSLGGFMFRDEDLVILVPMLGRSRHIDPLVESVVDTVCGARILFLCTHGDDEVINHIESRELEYTIVPRHPIGDYARKINYGVRATTEPLIFLGASDLKFHPNWYQNATRLLDTGIGVIGTNDLGSPRVIRGDHSTHSLITREYANLGTIDDPTKVLHEGYWHEYVDDEFIETARKRKAYRSATDSHVEHMHPNWGKAQVDGMYSQQQVRMRVGRGLYQARRRLWT